MKKTKKIFLLLPLLLLTGCINDVDPVKPDVDDVDDVDDVTQVEKDEKRTLEIYALNDFHGAYMFNESYSQTGMSRIGKFLIDKKENNPENTIILSSGDMFQGGPESNITRGDVVIDSMNAIGFDSMTIGNHEFDWGEEALRHMNEKMNFPFLGLNVFYANTTTRPDYLAPSCVIKKDGLNVGIIGSIQAGIESSIIATVSSKFDYKYANDLIEKEAIRLKDEEKCDVVILSSHDGNYRNYKDLSNVIDACFLGHSHKIVEGVTGGMPYIQGKHNGDYVSNINLDLVLNKETNRYEVSKSSSENIATFNNLNEESKKVNAVYDTYKDKIEPIRDEKLYNFKSTVSRSKFGGFMATCLKNYCNKLKINGVTVSAGLLNGSGSVRSDIPVGDFTYGDLMKVYPFENALCILKVKEKDYETYLTQSGYYQDLDSTPTVKDGYVYVATIDYVAYGNYVIKDEIYAHPEILVRDIVADELKTNGFPY